MKQPSEGRPSGLRKRPCSRKGQAMLESIIALVFLFIIFFLVLDYAELLKTRTVMDYAAARGARARAVGFNDFMVTKTLRIASMSVAGRCLTTELTGGFPSAAFLNSRAGSYLETESESYTKGILDFELWDSGKFSWNAIESYNGRQGDVVLQVRQLHPLLSSLPGGVDESVVRGEAKMESHYRYYLK